MKRIPASAATRERLQQLFDGQGEVEDRALWCARRCV